MFWQIMAPKAAAQPTGALADAIKSTFGGFDSFKEQFTKAGATRFGSGWAWLVETAASSSIASTPIRTARSWMARSRSSAWTSGSTPTT